jgi:outer membrane receptor protein involved in Fe transport
MSRPIDAELCLPASNAKLRRLLTGASGAALSLALMAPAGAAFAQAQPTAGGANLPTCQPGQTDTSQCKPAASNEVQTVVVTGSRIARHDYQSASPIVTLSAQNLVQQADLEIQNTLNKLPQFNPDQNMIGGNTLDTQNNPTHTVGISTLSLRGLGPNRNLVLVDGRRAAPVNASLVADINTIPTAMVDHVETITGGASATYGPDAIGGVVNFVLKKNFHGADFDLQYGFNQAGDGRQFSANALFGTNFADDKGNITFYIERFQSDPAYQRNRSFYSNSWKDPTTGGTTFFPTGTELASDFANAPSQLVVNQLLGQGGLAFPNTSTINVFGNIVFGGNGAPPFGNSPPGGYYKNPFKADGTGTHATQYVLDGANGNTLQPVTKYNSINQIVQQQLERWAFVTNGHYDFNDWLTATFDASYDRTHTFTFLDAAISITAGWNTYIPFNPTTDSPVLNTGTNAAPNYVANPGFLPYNAIGSQHPVPLELAKLLISRPNPAGQWQMNWFPNPDGPIPGRGINADNQLFQVEGGLQGKIPGNNAFTKDWTWNAFGTHSESYVYNVANGQWSLQRFESMVSQPGWAYGANIVGNQKNPVTGATVPSPGFGAGAVTCQSGFYNALFNGGTLSNDCFGAINAPLQSMNITKQDQVEFDVQGSLFKLPAGELKFAAGADYRRDSTIFNPDILQSYNSFTDQAIGLYPEPYTNAAEDVKEGYAELDIPILADLPFVKSFSINPGARYSSYSGSQGGWTYKVMGDFQVNDWIRLRGGYNLAVRAPNIGELYQGKTQTVTFAFIQNGDPCSLLSTSSFGAGGAAAPLNPVLTTNGGKAPVTNASGLAGATSTYYICQALMGAQGASNFYGNSNAAQPPAGSAFALLSNQSGNPNLMPETAKTYTGGIVLRSPFQDNEWLRRLTLTVDYYKIHIDNMISYTSIDYTLGQCFTGVHATDLASAQTYINSNPFCPGIGRTAGGGLGLIATPQSNLATADTAGIDISIDWGIPLSQIHQGLPGVFTFSMDDTFLDHFNYLPFKGAAWQMYYGSLGTGASLDGGNYAYRLNTTFGYNVGPANISLNWRHLPAVWGGVPQNTVNNHSLPYAGYDIFDLNGFFNLPHGLQLRASISNLLNKQPPTSATTPTLTNGVITTLGNDGAGSTNAAYYDTIGRRFSIGLKARF